MGEIVCRPPIGADRDAWAELFCGYVAFYKVAANEEVVARVWGKLLDPAHAPRASRPCLRPRREVFNPMLSKTDARGTILGANLCAGRLDVLPEQPPRLTAIRKRCAWRSGG